jgi:hypothetical protein
VAQSKELRRSIQRPDDITLGDAALDRLCN